MSLFSRGRIYLDHAGATPIAPDAARAMARAASLPGNPGAIHTEGVEAARALERARETIASHLGAKAREIIFTSGLTESNNLAILGFARARMLKGESLVGTHWIVGAIEHPSILECFAQIELMGGAVTHVDPDSRGIISAEVVGNALRPQTVFASIGWANSEIGVVQRLSAISQVIRAHEKKHKTRIVFHADAGQAPLYLSPTVHSLGVDLFSLGSGKLYGPRGIGALWVSPDVSLASIILGGGQERGLRAGTEEVALAAGFAEAMRITGVERSTEAKRLRVLRDRFAEELLKNIPGSIINGDLDRALPHILNISIPHVQSEYLLLSLDRAGLALSTKSACAEGEESESHVVAALLSGESERWRATNTLRFSLGRGTNERDMKRAARIVVEICKRVQHVA